MREREIIIKKQRRRPFPFIALIAAVALAALAVFNVVLLTRQPPRIGRTIYLTVRGTALAPDFADGDVAVVDTSVTPAVGDTALLKLDGAYVLERIARMEADGPVVRLEGAEQSVPASALAGTVTGRNGPVAFLTSPVVCVLGAIAAAALLFYLFISVFVKLRHERTR